MAAKLCGGRVEVGQARTERAQVFANKDGSFTSSQAATVQRVRKPGGVWAKPDPTLQRTDQGYVPVASTVDMAFSAGGDSQLVRLRDTTKKDHPELALRWQGTLPEPVAKDNTLTYPEVRPGVDLVVTATVEGFSEVLVVKNAEAAASEDLTTVRLAAEGKALRLKKGSGDSLVGVADSGETIFGSGVPMMWDSAAGKPGAQAGAGAKSSPAGPAQGAKSAAMKLSVSDGGREITVKPDKDLLRGKNTTYPVYIDPAIFRSSWTMINNRFENQSYWSYDRGDCPRGYAGLECPKVGFTDEATKMAYRSMFVFGTGDYVGKHVLDAKLSMDLLYSWECANSRTDVHLVSGDVGPGTNWANNSSTWSGAITSVTNNSCNRSRIRSEWNVTGTAQQAATQWWGRTTFGLKAANESNHSGWKKFDAGTAYLTVTFNSYPNAPDTLTLEGAGCVTGANRPYVRTLTPKLKARLSDPDGADRLLNGTFWWWPLGGSQSGSDAVSQGAIASGTTAEARIPAGRLVDGQTYVTRAQAADGIDTGQYSNNCEFTVDVTPPGAPGPVTSASYPEDGQLHGGAGVAGAFTFTPPASGAAEVTGYAYTLQGGVSAEQATQVAADSTSHGANVAITPPTDGNKTLRVWTRDIAGNFSTTPVTYQFSVRPGAGPDAYWKFDEGSGTTVVDASGHGNTLALPPDISWTPGRGGVGSARLFVGRSDQVLPGAGGGTTAGPIITKDPITATETTVRTDANFTVSAWARLDQVESSIQTVVSQDGNRSSAFALEYNGADGRWEFMVNASDGNVFDEDRVLSDSAPTVGAWTYLVGTFDSATKAIRLYVNGVLQAATATVTGEGNATGPIAIGRRKSNWMKTGSFFGAIDEVRVYSRVLDTGEPEFGNPLNPVSPTITFPDGATTKVGQGLRVTIDTGGDPTATSVKYSIGTKSLASTAALPSPGGQVTVTVTPRVAGEQYVVAVATSTAGRQSETAAKLVKVLDAPAIGGVVMDQTGAPVSGATVRLMPWGGTVTTGNDGGYVFGGLSQGIFTVSATMGSNVCASYAATQIIVEGSETVNLTLGPQSDSFGYTCSVKQQAFISAETILNTGTNVSGTMPVDFPFPVPYYGDTKTAGFVSYDGAIYLSEPAGYPDFQSIPSGAPPHGVIAPFWVNLGVDESTSLRTGVVGSAPHRRFVVEWRNAVVDYMLGQVITFEVVFDENGDITFNYGELNTAEQQGEWASVGIESPGGHHGMQYSFEQSVLRTGQAITFHYPQNPKPIEKASISGLITDSGVPVAGAAVTVLPTEMTVFTGPDGRYTVPDLETSGGYTMVVESNCRGAAVTAPIWLSEDATVDLAISVTVDDFGYWCEIKSQPYLPASGPTIPMVSEWEGTYKLSLPFQLPLYGRGWWHPVVDAETGLVSFAPAYESESAASGSDVVVPMCAYCYPDLYPYFRDLLDGAPLAAIRTGIVGSAPNRQAIIEWRDLPLDVAGTKRVSFEAILSEDGTITYNYEGLDDDEERGLKAKVGVIGPGSSRKIFSDHKPWLDNNQAIVFHPPVN